MTVYESWVSEMVKIAVGEMRESCEPDWGDTCARTAAERDRYRNDYHEEWGKLEQRIACLLTQARALECRHLAGELVVKYGNSQAAKVIASGCWDRSHKLETIATMFASQWPPAEHSTPEPEEMSEGGLIQ